MPLYLSVWFSYLLQGSGSAIDSEQRREPNSPTDVRLGDLLDLPSRVIERCYRF